MQRCLNISLFIFSFVKESNAKYRIAIQGDDFGSFAVSPTSGIGRTAVTIKVKSTASMDYEIVRYRRQIIQVRDCLIGLYLKI